jgi:putative iron-dependent peroxidase
MRASRPAVWHRSAEEEAMAVNEPQGGVLPEPPESALFLVLNVRDRARDGRAVAGALARVPELTRKLARSDPRARLRSVVSLGEGLWDAVSPERRPRAFRPFPALEADGRRAPATGGDVLLHATARRPDLCFELALCLRRELGDRANVLEEVHGFRYLDLRDLTGFIDGTENPKGRERAEAALIGAEDPAFAGGSFVFTQRYVHDLAKWAGLSVREQEGVFGRRKRDSRELSARAKPPTAHIARTVIEEDGKELEIVRHSFPYGTTSESGLFFIAYTKDLAIPEKMLRRMLGVSGDGLHDRLLEFTRAVSGATFFAPSLRLLRSLGAR